MTTTIKRIVMRPVERTQCSWTVQGANREQWFSEQEKRHLKFKGMDFKLCPKWSTHIINNKHFCSQHAGVVALKILTES